VTLNIPLSGVILGQEVATTNQGTTFEVSISTHYEDMAGDTKCRKLGGLR